MLHAAAWTDVDGAEDDPQGAAAVNVGGTRNVAALGAPARLFLLRLCVRRREARAVPRVRLARPARCVRPEQAARGGGGRRGPGSSAPPGSSARRADNFVRTMLRLGRERDEVSVVDDQLGCPTYTGHLASAVAEVVELPFGVYHLAASGECTWAEFAAAIFEEAGIACRVRPISTTEFGAKAKRPAYSVMRSEKGAPELPPWREGLRECLALALSLQRSVIPPFSASASRLLGGPDVSVIGDGPDLAPSARVRTLISSSVRAMRVLVTGGAGFIGSHFVRRLVAAGDEVVVLDKLTYAGNRENLAGVSHEFHQGDIADHRAVEKGRGRLRRDRELRRRDPCRPLDQRPGGVHRHRRARHPGAPRSRPSGRDPPRPGLDRRGIR